MNGLYFYKLVSPYQEDVTKDCKLTINEIDNNFLNLKSNEISNAHIDENEKKIYLTRNNGEDLILDLAKVTENPAFDVNYDSADGVIEIKNDGETYSIKDLITKDNLSKEILTKVYSDSTLSGVGTAASPLKLSSIQKTGHYKAAIKVLDSTINEHLPKKGNAKGDRYVTLEEVNEFGLLYNFDAVRHINQLLQKTGWRVATKADWDNMLNAIEPCEYRDHASTLNNRVLGHVAGSLLKATHDWRTAGILDDMNKPCQCPCPKPKSNFFDPFEVEDTVEEIYSHHPEKKNYPSEGKDAYGMGILPGGYAYYSKPMQYNQFGFQGAYWTTDMMYDTDVYTKVFEAGESGVLQLGERPSAFLSIRLVKDYDGSNDYGVENILGDNYKTVLMPSLNNPNGYAVWTAQNFRLREARLESTIPNAGLGVRREKVYFINEWNGFGWDKLQMEEGDTVVVLNSQNWNETHRIIEGKLTNVTAYISTNIRHEVKADLDAIRSRIHEAEHQINDNSRKIDRNRQSISEIEVVNAVQDDRIQRLEEDLTHTKWKHGEDVKDILQKIDDLKQAADEEHESNKGETNDRFEEDEKRIEDLEQKTEELDNRVTDLEQKTEELEQKIEDESKAREEADKELQENIDKETQEREEADQVLQENIDTEVERAQEAEKKLQENIDAEQERAENAELELQENIDKEQERAEAAEQELSDRATDLEAHRLKSEGVEGGSYYDDKEGKLTLVAENPEYNIEVTFSFDFGTIKSKD